MALLIAASSFGALVTIPFLPLPAPQSWPYICLSVLLHIGYSIFLIFAYKFGDLGHVYPLARGSAPLMVALVSITVIGEQLSHLSLLVIVIMAAGIMSLSLTRGAQNLRNPQAVFFALGTGVFIASYTITDGLGARLAGNSHSYAAWIFALEGLPLMIFFAIKKHSQTFSKIQHLWKPAFLMGLMSLLAYWAVIWAMTVAPIALVATIRETSIIFALLFGVFFLKEKLGLVQLVATFTTLIGIVLLKINHPL
ncbi:MAG: EamA family transporter [bacterium]|nr:EamA family transporter [bacterium]